MSDDRLSGALPTHRSCGGSARPSGRGAGGLKMNRGVAPSTDEGKGNDAELRMMGEMMPRRTLRMIRHGLGPMTVERWGAGDVAFPPGKGSRRSPFPEFASGSRRRRGESRTPHQSIVRWTLRPDVVPKWNGDCSHRWGLPIAVSSRPHDVSRKNFCSWTSLPSSHRRLESDADVVAFVDEGVGEKEGEVTPSLMKVRRRVASSLSSRILTTA